MISFLLENLSTILISLVLAGVVALIVAYLVRQRRRGGPDECAGCEVTGCPYCPPRRNG